MNLEEMLAAVYDLPEGDYAEAGVWKGFMAEQIARAMNPKDSLWLFDSFKGHYEPSEFDDAVRHPKGRYADTSVEEVQARIPRAGIIAGDVVITLKCVARDLRYKFVHIDLDHYWPTKAACEFFKPRMIPHGIIRFDDYGFSECPGATKAIDEVFGRANVLSEDARWIAP